MTNFEKTQVTEKALSYISDNGLTVNFTKVETGSGSYESGEDVSKRTGLKSKMQEFQITSAEKDSKSNNIVDIKFVINNTELEESYKFTEIGIYATGTDGKEFLYALCYSTGEHADTIQKYNGLFEAQIILILKLQIANDAKITVNNSGLYALQEDLEKVAFSGNYNDLKDKLSDFVKSGSDSMSGLVPAPPQIAGTSKYLREDGTWTIPPAAPITATEFEELKSDYEELSEMIVTNNYSSSLVDDDGTNILTDDNNVLFADWKGAIL